MIKLGSRTKASIALTVTVLLLVLRAGFTYAQASEPGTKSQATQTVTLPAEEVPLFNLFTEVKEFIKNYHTKAITDEQLYQGAIKGMLEAISDPYSQYMTEEELDNLSSSIEGEYVGIGVTIELINGNITVVSTFRNSPAEEAGVRPGDIIIGAGGIDLRGKTHVDASNILRGPEGTEVTVNLKRPATGETLTLRIVRARITPPTLALEDLGDGIYRIEISQFTSATGREFAPIMGFLRMRQIRGLILDLRNNPGGLLDDCIEVAEELVPKGPIVELRRKDLKQVIENEKDTVPVPVVVLVNKGTASAAEILAGAIKDRGVGILVGEPTFGKACIQAVVPLGDNMGGIRLTIADYYTPSGKSISGTGLQPDIFVKPEVLKAPDRVNYKRPLKRGLVGLDVLALQEGLKFLGYDVGEPDGIFGPRTERACANFCKDHGLPYNGAMTEREVDALYFATLDKVKNAPDVVLEKGIEVLRNRLTTGNW
ncbi:MAG TPA: S41 family peptidase [Firmicutes bacterium]|nr:S41 family peptidase [Candidatus Fermentithermobacillaceae bacterium]